MKQTISRPIRGNKGKIVDLYRKRAKGYYFTASLYYLIGFRLNSYRERAVEALNLHHGDTIVEIGCGTGLNFPLFQKAVGPEVKIIGVDAADSILTQARRRVAENGWTNVELVQSDAASVKFSSKLERIISTFAITLSPDFDRIIQNANMILSPGGCWGILNFKLPSSWPAHLAPLVVFLTRLFGVSIEPATRHPWESISKCLSNTSLAELYGGFAYIATGERLVENHKPLTESIIEMAAVRTKRDGEIYPYHDTMLPDTADHTGYSIGGRCLGELSGDCCAVAMSDFAHRHDARYIQRRRSQPLNPQAA